MLARCRKFLTLVALVAGFSHAGNVLALGLGELTVYSDLNEPLDASIQMLGLDGLEENQITAVMAGIEDFERAGAQRFGLIDDIEIEVIILSNDEGILHLTSDDPVVEPFLNLVLSVRWPTGRLMRDYTALIDLPIFVSDEPQIVPVDVPETPAPAAEPAPEPIPEAAPQTEILTATATEAPQSEPSAPDAQEIAEEPLPSPEPAEADIEADIEAESQAQESSPGIASEPDPEPAPAEESTSEITMDVEEDEIVVQEGDTLYEIAANNRPGSSVSVEQTMLAIQRSNPDAFVDDNINMIMVGQILRIPSIQEVQSIDQSQALNQIALQNQATTGQPLAFSNNNAADDQSGVDELTILSGDEGTDSLSGNSDMAETIAALENQLAISEENLDRARLENEELVARYAQLEEQIEILQNIIAMQDERLAQLQADLAARAEEEAQAAAAAPAPPVVSTPAQPPQVDNSLMGQLSRLFENTIVLLSSLVGLIVLVLGFLVWRRRSADAEMDEMVLAGAVADQGSPEVFAADDSDDDAPQGFLAALKSRFSGDDEDDFEFEYEDDQDVATLPAQQGEESDDAEDFAEIDDEDALADDDDLDDEDTESEVSLAEEESDDEEASVEDTEDDLADYYDEDDEEDEGFLARLKNMFSRSDDDDDEFEEDIDDDAYIDEEVDEEADEEADEESDEDDAALDAGDDDDEYDEDEDQEVNDEEVSVAQDALLEAEEEDAEDATEESEEVFDIKEDDAAFDIGDLSQDDSAATDEVQTASSETGDGDSDTLEFNLDDTADQADAEEIAEPEDEEDPALDSLEFSLDDADEEPEEASEGSSDTVEVEGIEFNVGDTAAIPELKNEEEDSDAAEEVEGLDFDLSALSSPDEDTGDAEAQAGSADQDEDDDVISIDVDTADEDLGAAVEVDDIGKADEEKAESESDAEDSGEEFDLGNLDIDDSLFVMDDEDSESGDEPISDRDESSTKLDLAVAYEAMGDLDGAKEILNEVVAEGNPEQVAEAKKLLEKWDLS